MTTSQKRASRTARLNEEFRRHAGLAKPDVRIPPGRCVMTAGVAALGREAQAEILGECDGSRISTPGNDPHGEHDFGVPRRTGSGSSGRSITLLTRRWNTVPNIPRTQRARIASSGSPSPRNVPGKSDLAEKWGRIASSGSCSPRNTEGLRITARVRTPMVIHGSGDVELYSQCSAPVTIARGCGPGG